MMLWFAGTPCTFRTLRPGEVRYEVCACSGRPLEQRTTVRDPLGDPSEHGRNTAGMRTERMGSPLGDPMNCFFVNALGLGRNRCLKKLKHPNPCEEPSPGAH